MANADELSREISCSNGELYQSRGRKIEARLGHLFFPMIDTNHSDKRHSFSQAASENSVKKGDITHTALL